jgi:hypothetical protein
MRGKDQLEILHIAATGKFREHELVMRQQQGTLRGKFNA